MMEITLAWIKDTKNFALYQEVNGINKLYLPKGLPRTVSVIVQEVAR